MTDAAKRPKPSPTLDDLHTLLGWVDDLEDDIAHVRDGLRNFDLSTVPAIGQYGVETLNQETDKALSAIEWLGIILTDAYDAMDAAGSAVKEEVT